MSKGIKATLGNPLGTFLRSIVMFLAGIILGEHWHPSGAVVLAVTVVGAVLAVLHELLSCFLWCSFASWWTGRRSQEIEEQR